MSSRRTERVAKWTPDHPRHPRHRRSGSTLAEMLMVMSIIGLFAAATGLSSIGNRESLRETQVVSGLLSGVRQCRQEAITRNQPVRWWISNGYLAWWCDTDEDGVQIAEEVETQLLDEMADYASYPQQGCFDGRGIHSTNQSSFNGMMVWIQLEKATHLVTVSANGHVSRYQY